MNYGPLIFLGAFFALATSWFGLVLNPHLQLGHLQQTNAVPSGPLYPLGRPGLANQGLQVYRANGCVYCHSQQVGQSTPVCDVILNEVGTNHVQIRAALLKLQIVSSEKEGDEWLATLPKTVVKGSDIQRGETTLKALKAAGAKCELWVVPAGPDIARGWGKRRSVAADFLFDYPVMLGSQRIGPDLANIGLRTSDENTQLLHLYAPRLLFKDSAMPPYRFLFEKQRIGRAPSPDALNLPQELAPPPGYEIVPTVDAKALVAYLTSLRADAPLFVAPFTTPSVPATNAPAQGGATNAPAQEGATNAPPK